MKVRKTGEMLEVHYEDDLVTTITEMLASL